MGVEEEEEEEEEQGWEAGGEPGRARGSGKWETGIQGRDRGREFGTGTRDGKKGEGRSERGGWGEKRERGGQIKYR